LSPQEPRHARSFLVRETARIAAVFWKDVTIEARAKANFNAVAFLAGLILLLFGFALGPDQDALHAAAAGVIWLTVLFSGVLSFNRSYEQELENGALDALLLYPGDRRSIFLGKLLANLVFVLGVQLILVPTAAVLYNLSLGRVILPLAAIVALGTLGFVTLGTFYSAMASRLRAREVLLPLLLFPMLIPLLLGAVQATEAALTGNLLGNLNEWVRLLVLFDLVFLTVSILAFEYVIGE
jgi:heme exporter protein B